MGCCLARSLLQLYAEVEDEFKRFDPADYARRIREAYAARAISKRMKRDLLYALDRGVVRRLVLTENEWGHNSDYAGRIESGLDAVLESYLKQRTGGARANVGHRSCPCRPQPLKGSAELLG